MNLGSLLAANILDPTKDRVIGTRDRKDHSLAPLDLFRRSHTETVVGNPNRREQLNGEVPLSRIVEKGDDAGHWIRVLNQPGPD